MDQLVRTVAELDEHQFRNERSNYADDAGLTKFRRLRELAFIRSADLSAFSNDAFLRLKECVATTKSACSILDVGGSFGIFGKALAAQMPDRIASYTVLELPEVTQAAGAVVDVGFVNDFSEVKDRPDIVIASGTIQYVDDPLAFVRCLMAVGSKTLILARTFLSDTRPRYFRQNSPMFDHGTGPLPEGFENRLIASFAQAVHWDALRDTLEPAYRIVRGSENTSGLILADDDLFGSDLILTRR